MIDIFNEFDGKLNKNAIYECGYESGFILPYKKQVIIGTHDLFAKKRLNHSFVAGKENVFSVPKIGDYVVHQNHGIAVYTGITQLNVDGVRKDYLTLTYKGSDTLYVPTDQLDMVFRYDKKEGARVKRH